jgi:hypothetical protein
MYVFLFFSIFRALETQEPTMLIFGKTESVYRQNRSVNLSKWFYDTSIGTATRAVHCGSLLEGLRLSYA